MAQSVPPSPSQFTSSKEIRQNSANALLTFGSKFKFSANKETQLGQLKSFQKKPVLLLKASTDPPGLIQELTRHKEKSAVEKKNESDLFNEMKHQFLSFKKHNYQENLECYQNLAKGQSPKFLVISCADSRVCPSNILGFQPGDAFIVRNVANLVPPFESKPFETKAALEFSVNSLEVPNILVIGHSCCGGIRALMSMQDEEDSISFIKNWVVVGKNASLSTKAVASNLSFDQQCRHCEKESVNRSLWILLTYPWIAEKVKKGGLSIHGGYYDFIDCTFEKWSLDYHVTGSFVLKKREFWS